MAKLCDGVKSSRAGFGKCGPTRGLPTSLPFLAVALLLLSLVLPTTVGAQPATCNSGLQVGYTSGPNFAIPGPTPNAANTYRVQLTLGAQDIQNGTFMTIDGIDFGLDCTQATVGNGGPAGCTSDTNKISFLSNIGNVAAGCQNAIGEPVNVVTAHASPSPTPNNVHFTFTVNGGPNNGNPTSLRVLANTSTCTFQFDVQVLEASSADSTPNRVEENAFYNTAVCDNNLASASAQSSGINTCPTCDDGNACTTDSCDPATGQCTNTPISCNDNNACTTDSCNPATGQCTNTPISCNDNNACTTDSCNPATGQCINTPTSCNDNNACTTDSCNPANGQCTNTPISCNDNNACTTDSCNPATGQCINTPTSCNDNNACTTDSCNPANGQCTNTPISCNDNNACTTDSCNPVTGCTTTPVTCNDGNACTIDSCNPATGECTIVSTINCDDNNACTTDSCNPATGQCVHTPIEGTSCEPIPTLSEWGMFALIALLALAGMMAMRRRPS